LPTISKVLHGPTVFRRLFQCIANRTSRNLTITVTVCVFHTWQHRQQWLQQIKF